MSQKPSEARNTKRVLQNIHRVIDRYRERRNADACMQEICRLLHRDPRVSILNGKEG